VPAEVEAPTDGAGTRSALTTHVLTSLHAILKPFLLRRLKVDVEHSLPPKKEYVLYAPVTKAQKELYEAVLEGRIREWLVSRATGEAIADIVSNEQKADAVTEEDEDEKEESAAQRRPRRSTARVDYRVANDPGDNDEAYIDKLEAGLINQRRMGDKHVSAAIDIGRGYHLKQARKFCHSLPPALVLILCAEKKVNNMRLQNVIMQLRKVCSHPFLFDWPTDPESGQPMVNTELVNASGKMLLLDRLLTELILRGHKVLIFSQFTTMLDIIQVKTLRCHWRL
jgi:ATP-dependent DNA helicase